MEDENLSPTGGGELGSATKTDILEISEQKKLLKSFTVYSKAGVAQLVEHQPSKLRVAGSIPVSRSIVVSYC